MESDSPSSSPPEQSPPGQGDLAGNQGLSRLRRVWTRLNTPVTFAGQRQKNGGRPAQQRGIALILVMTMLVMFTAYVADFSFESRLRYTLASHARDEIKAQIMAENGIRQFRMLLEFEQQFLKSLGQQNLTAILPMLGFSPNQSIIVQMTRNMPLPCNAMAMLSSASGGGEDEGAEGGAEGGGGGGGMMGALLGNSPDGACSVKAETEASKLYSLKGLRNNITGIEHNKLARLVELFESEEFKDELRVANITPEELAGNIGDWADENNTRYNGQGYEDNLYNRGDDAYLPKNRDFDSIAELRLVSGMTDAIFAKLAKRVTVFEDRFVLPITEPTTLGDVVAFVTSGRWRDTQENRQALWKAYQESYISNIPPTPPSTRQEFEAAIAQVPGGLSAMLDPDKMNGLFPPTVNPPGGGGAKVNLPKVYTLTARAQVGDVTRTLRVVLDMNQSPGKLLYWRED